MVVVRNLSLLGRGNYCLAMPTLILDILMSGVLQNFGEILDQQFVS